MGIFSNLFGSSDSGRPPSPAQTKLNKAKKDRVTDFGTGATNLVTSPDKTIEAPVGTYVVHNDGTFTDTKNGLMWIQAYWGMDYNGKKFTGEYIGLSWYTATDLFGQGQTIAKSAALRIEDTKKLGPLSYTAGRCRVEFAGYSNWRLPTAAELLTLSFTDEDIDGFWGPGGEKASELRATLFPDCPDGGKREWSANDNGEFAWASDGSKSLGDYEKRIDRPVLFVRNRAPGAA